MKVYLNPWIMLAAGMVTYWLGAAADVGLISGLGLGLMFVGLILLIVKVMR